MKSHIATIRQLGSGISFQDQGRISGHNWLKYGVAPAGWMDSFAATTANKLVYNLKNDTVLELMMGGAVLEFNEGCWISHVGGLDCQQLPNGHGRFIEAGEKLFFTPNKKGVWSYLAIAGGWAASEVFGSCARHERSNLGDPLDVGSLLYCNYAQPTGKLMLTRRSLAAVQRSLTPCPKLKLYPGPHMHLLNSQQLMDIIDQAWQISSRSDRTGYRLSGENSKKLSHDYNISSTPTLVGSFQLPPSGEPIITLNDGPTMGGYPIIGMIEKDDLSWLTQQHAGNTIQFRWT